MDVVNALFEFFGGCLLWLSVRRLWIDRKVAGISVLPIFFYACWGVWNLWYYPALGQWLSFVAGINVVSANATWVTLALRFKAGRNEDLN